MKVHVGAEASSSPTPAKRRWRCLAATGLALFFFALVVPLAVLLGLHKRFPSGYVHEDHSTPTEDVMGVYENLGGESSGWDSRNKGNASIIDDLLVRFGPDLLQINSNSSYKKSIEGEILKQWPSGHDFQSIPTSKEEPQVKKSISHPSLLPAQLRNNALEDSSLNAHDFEGAAYERRFLGDGNDTSCQHGFGSYCLWSVAHKEQMKDSNVRKLKDQLFVARAYYPSIAKIQNKDKLTQELKQSIQDHERILNEAISDADLPSSSVVRLESMAITISKARSCLVDCQNVEKKFRQLLDMTEDEAHFHMKQSAFLYHLGTQTLPKSHHCLSMRLTVEYFKSFLENPDLSHSDKLQDQNLQHYVIFSTNVLAASVAINSTVMNSEGSGSMVFHIITDVENFYAFKNWFIRNSYKEAVINVLNWETLGDEGDSSMNSRWSPYEEFRVSFQSSVRSSRVWTTTEYLSVFGHSMFRLPAIFPDLRRVVVLDDDIVVQKDLSSLWELDLKGKVLGAIVSCGVRLGQLGAYIQEHVDDKHRYDARSCSWMSGLNIVDLHNWREHDISRIHNDLMQKVQEESEERWRAAALAISFLAFEDQIHPLDRSWVQSSLGHKYGIAYGTLKRSMVLHFNGKMKPWLDLGIRRYKKYWRKYLTREEQFLIDCNVNP